MELLVRRGLALLSLGFLPLVVLVQAEATRSDAPAESRSRAARLANARDARKKLGLTPEYEAVRGVEKLKIAVLDYGFAGMETGRAYLPENTVVVEHYDADFIRRHHLGDPEFKKELDQQNQHGRLLAQIIWGVTGHHADGPRFFLLNANGPTMLRRAVRYAIEQEVDIILFSGSFEGGGNGDGRGFINRIVADALAADIIWINAAGNYGRRVYNGPIQVGSDGFLRFRDGNDPTALRFRNRLDENTITITLTWNDYREEEDAGTDKDLDLFVEDWIGKGVGASTKTQVKHGSEIGPEESRNPRERVVLMNLPANLDYNYRIRIQARKQHLFGSRDRIRVLVTAARESYVDPETEKPEEAVPFFDASGRGELYPPADYPLVITVGDSNRASSVGPTADHRVKPDVLLDDVRAYFSDGHVSDGSSNAAAYFAGIVAVLKAAEPGLRLSHLLDLARQNKRTAAVSQPISYRFSADSLRPVAGGRWQSADRSAISSTVPSWLLARVWKTPTSSRLRETIQKR